MKKSLVALAILALSGAAGAQAFVYPKEWSATAPTEVKRGGTFRDYTISDYKTLEPVHRSRVTEYPRHNYRRWVLHLRSSKG